MAPTPWKMRNRRFALFYNTSMTSDFPWNCWNANSGKRRLSSLAWSLDVVASVWTLPSCLPSHLGPLWRLLKQSSPSLGFVTFTANLSPASLILLPLSLSWLIKTTLDSGVPNSKMPLLPSFRSSRLPLSSTFLTCANLLLLRLMCLSWPVAEYWCKLMKMVTSFPAPISPRLSHPLNTTTTDMIGNSLLLSTPWTTGTNIYREWNTWWHSLLTIKTWHISANHKNSLNDRCVGCFSNRILTLFSYTLLGCIWDLPMPSLASLIPTLPSTMPTSPFSLTTSSSVPSTWLYLIRLLHHLPLTPSSLTLYATFMLTHHCSPILNQPIGTLNTPSFTSKIIFTCHQTLVKMLFLQSTCLLLLAMLASFTHIQCHLGTIGGLACPPLSVASLLVAPFANRWRSIPTPLFLCSLHSPPLAPIYSNSCLSISSLISLCLMASIHFWSWLTTVFQRG